MRGQSRQDIVEERSRGLDMKKANGRTWTWGVKNERSDAINAYLKTEIGHGRPR